MLIMLLYLLLTVFSSNAMTSKDSDEAWEKWGKEDTSKSESLLEQWAKFNVEPSLEKTPAKTELSDTLCGSVPAEKHFSPNKYISRLNGAQMIHDYPAKCKEHYMNMMVDIMCSFIEDLNAQNVVDIEIMMQELLALRNLKNAETIDKVFEKIKNLKEE